METRGCFPNLLISQIQESRAIFCRPDYLYGRTGLGLAISCKMEPEDILQWTCLTCTQMLR